MISDTLSDAVASINDYLADELYDEVYAGSLRDRIVALRDEMDALRAELDAPPLVENHGRAFDLAFALGRAHARRMLAKGRNRWWRSEDFILRTVSEKTTAEGIAIGEDTGGVLEGFLEGVSNELIETAIAERLDSWLPISYRDGRMQVGVIA